MDQIQSFFGQTPINNEEEKKEDESQLGPQTPPLQQPALRITSFTRNSESKEEDEEEDEMRKRIVKVMTMITMMILRN